jgi:hypothetical protein
MKKIATPDHSVLDNPKENGSKETENDELPKALRTRSFCA